MITPEMSTSINKQPTSLESGRQWNHTSQGHDNPVFDTPRSRKVSATSDHSDMGPVRKKSILHNNSSTDLGRHIGDERSKKTSVTESVHSRARFSDIEEENRSWWYSFCLKCRSKESHPSWRPSFWSKACPYPFCPTYRQFSRIVAISLIGLLAWGIVYSVIGDTAAPGGQLFQLIFLSIAAHFGGWLMTLTTLPALIGMLAVGLLFGNVGLVEFDDSFAEVTKVLREIALVIILTRAGLDLDPQALKKLKFTVLKLGVGPWLIEAAVITVMSRFLLQLPWDWSMLLGSIVAAVSPAVVVPCLFRLRRKGYGVAKGIPTLIIAVAGIDDALSVAGFGIIRSIMFSNDTLLMQILQGPICVIGGIGFGILWGAISSVAPERYDPFVVPLRIIMLLSGGLIAVMGSEVIGYSGAGPLGCVAAAFVSLCFWTKQGWEVEDNPAAIAFEIFWMIFEPILFGVTGAQVKFSELSPDVVSIGLGCLVGGIVLRICGTALLGIGCRLNLKEKFFVGIAWMSKATVQAALGPIPLSLVGTNADTTEYANKVLMVCVLSIILTAPTGATLITIFGPRLLTKTKIPHIPEGWRRSHRPSIRDISIIDEDEERTDSSIEQSNGNGIGKMTSQTKLDV
ncbi:sodium/hydrogen exchanger 9B2 isoform X2 [Agrilus planipennis]|uniref:Sodium/hydrogen exchanger 9B2 isoform X2 n=1 Tax=Agrilus planipennis TaxID=224129 RepID=A0A1W4X2R6_AGRPL|nr:sodium/hydrogen exchanger 9B2 isoform X2 [Agrilus planipennis]